MCFLSGINGQQLHTPKAKSPLNGPVLLKTPTASSPGKFNNLTASATPPPQTAAKPNSLSNGLVQQPRRVSLTTLNDLIDEQATSKGSNHCPADKHSSTGVISTKSTNGRLSSAHGAVKSTVKHHSNATDLTTPTDIRLKHDSMPVDKLTKSCTNEHSAKKHGLSNGGVRTEHMSPKKARLQDSNPKVTSPNASVQKVGKCLSARSAFLIT